LRPIRSHSKIQNQFAFRTKRIHHLKAALSRLAGHNPFKKEFADEREMIGKIFHVYD
jgi:hypothetical protein